MIGKTNLFVVSKYFTQFHSSNSAGVCFLQPRSTNKNHWINSPPPLLCLLKWQNLDEMFSSSAFMFVEEQWVLCHSLQPVLMDKEISYGMWCVMFGNWIVKFNYNFCVFVLEVLALMLYPQMMESDLFPQDVKARAQRLLAGCAGGSVGGYLKMTSTSLTITAWCWCWQK